MCPGLSWAYAHQGSTGPGRSLNASDALSSLEWSSFLLAFPFCQTLGFLLHLSLVLLFKKTFTYLWLCWVFVAACRIFYSCGSWRLLSSCGAQASHRGGVVAWALGMRASEVAAHGLSGCGLGAPEHRLSSCGSQA